MRNTAFDPQSAATQVGEWQKKLSFLRKDDEIILTALEVSHDK